VHRFEVRPEKELGMFRVLPRFRAG
jgi:hypothetical protein